MANKNLDNSSFVPRIAMSALREKTHLQKRLIKFNQEEEKQLRKIKQSQECLIKDLKGSGIDRQSTDLLAKQRQLMELRRARFSAPALGTMKRQSLRRLSGLSTEDDNNVKVQNSLSLPPSSTSRVMRPISQSLGQSFSAPVTPREFSIKESEAKDVLVNRAGFKQETISLKPPSLQPSPQHYLRLNDESARKSPSVSTTEEVDVAIVDIEQEEENKGDKDGQEEFWKVLIRRGTPDPGRSVTQSVTTQEGRQENTTQLQEAGERKVENKRRRKIGIHHCVNEIAPAFNGSVRLSNADATTQFIDCPREGGSNSAMSYTDEQREPSHGHTVDIAMQMQRAGSLSQISTSSWRKTSFSGTEKNPITSRLSVDGAAGYRLHEDVFTDINKPHLMRKMSFNQRVLSRGCSNELGRAQKDSIDHLDSDVNGEQKSSGTQMAAENFRRLAFLSLGSNGSFSGGEKPRKNSASAKSQPERKLSRERLEQIQKPTESSSRQLITKHRSVSVSGAHPKLHEQLTSAPDLRRSTPSGLRNFRKLSNSVIATNVFSAKQRRQSSVTKPTLPLQVNEEKTLSEMMTDIKDCRYLRSSVASSSNESELELWTDPARFNAS